MGDEIETATQVKQCFGGGDQQLVGDS